jgi:cytochrome P450
LITSKRKQPADDLTTALLQASEDGATLSLSDDEILAMDVSLAFSALHTRAITLRLAIVLQSALSPSSYFKQLCGTYDRAATSLPRQTARLVRASVKL